MVAINLWLSVGFITTVSFFVVMAFCFLYKDSHIGLSPPSFNKTLSYILITYAKTIFPRSLEPWFQKSHSQVLGIKGYSVSQGEHNSTGDKGVMILVLTVLTEILRLDLNQSAK